MNSLLNDLASLSEIPPYLLTIVLAWSLFWKALALWKSAKRDSKGWFVAILIINTMGIFEILYIFLFSEIKLDDKSKNKKTNKKSSKNSKLNLKSKKGFLE